MTYPAPFEVSIAVDKKEITMKKYLFGLGTEVKEDWIKKILACRGKLLSLPSKVAPQLPSCDTSQEIEEVLKDGIGEALAELC